MTTKASSKNYNPTGKGGFGDHPENIGTGSWDKNNSYSYWLHYFKSLSIDKFKQYKSKHPEMTMAGMGAYARVAKSIDDRTEFKEVADRTEGQPMYRMELDQTMKGEVRFINDIPRPEK